jgi:dephospho-CoA kinase
VLSVALTGNVGSGKSTVAKRWAAAGVPVVSADELSRQAVLPGSPGLAEVLSEFGDGVLAADGTLDRERLRDLVFADEGRRRALERILHPRIRELRDSWVRRVAAEGATLVVSEIPLLFETGAEKGFDVVVFVDAPAAVRKERLQRDRGLSADEADKIMASQMDPDEKRVKADIVIENDGTLEELGAAADRVLQGLRERAGLRTMKLDLHLHTNGSWDCLSDPEAVLDRALALGYERIAITDHDRLGVALRMFQKHPERIIPGGGEDRGGRRRDRSVPDG